MKKLRFSEPTTVVVNLDGGNMLSFKCFREVIEAHNLVFSKVSEREVRQIYTNWRINISE